MVDLSRFRGTFPYATELFGIYQPLLGWMARQARERVDREAIANISRTIRSMTSDSRFRAAVANALALQPPNMLLPPRVPSELRSAIATHVGGGIAQIVARNARLPTSAEWNDLLSHESLTSALRSAVSGTGPTGRAIAATTRAVAPPSTSPAVEAIVGGVLEYLQERAPRLVQRLLVGEPRAWEIRRDFLDPLGGHDPQTQQAVLSPMGILNLCRQYFFEFDSFLGPPVGHAWVSPGGSVELLDLPPGEPQPSTLREALLALADRIRAMNDDPSAIARTETVFENGFDPLAEGFRSPDRPFQPYELFDQWIEILPTDQVVALEYEPRQ